MPTQTFTTDGTFTVPSGVTSIRVEVWGKGGNGDHPGGGDTGNGGGGGGYIAADVSVSPAQEFDVNFAGGSVRFANAGLSLNIIGGEGATGEELGTGGVPSLVDTGMITSNVVQEDGGQGGSGGLEDEGGGGGGGGASTTEGGFPGNNAVGGTGGNGGAGGEVGGGAGGAGGNLGENGIAGTVPNGGGGGPGFGGLLGGAGATGKIAVTYEASASSACGIFDIDLRIMGTVVIR
jgi:hypothetical protein